MVEYDIDKLLYHRVRIKDIHGEVYEGEVVSFDFDLDAENTTTQIGIETGAKTGWNYVGIYENECESLEILD